VAHALDLDSSRISLKMAPAFLPTCSDLKNALGVAVICCLLEMEEGEAETGESAPEDNQYE